MNHYVVTYDLPIEIAGVECWNFTDNSKWTLPAGCSIKLDHEHDARRTTCSVRTNGEPGMVCGWRRGYRFIVPNTVLNAALNIDLPEETLDMVGLIMKYEAGEATEEETAALFADPVCRSLQGHYSSRCTAT